MVYEWLEGLVSLGSAKGVVGLVGQWFIGKELVLGFMVQ